MASRSVSEARTKLSMALTRAAARGLVVRASLESQGLELAALAAAAMVAAMVAATQVAEAVVKVAGMGAAARVDEAARVAEVATRGAAKKVAHW